MSEHKHIPVHDVTSSQIKAIGWQDEVLRVEFSRGGIYDYANVSEEQFEKFKNADSIGSAFFKTFKNNPKHPFAKVK